MSGTRGFFLTAGLLVWGSAVQAADWPTWRCDASRSSASGEDLPAPLHLQWTRALPPPAPAWPFDGAGNSRKLNFDWCDEPIVLGKTLYLGSSRRDTVTAFDTETGSEKWTFFTDGPVRFAPTGAHGRLYVVSDDGHLYCLDAETGRLVWKFRGAPTAGRLLGNGRLISAWPARGGPVLDDGKVYFAAGIWPFTGVFLYCLDAETGTVVWSNDESGHQNIAPQGYLVVRGERLIVPCGRGIPGMFDKTTGRMVAHPYKVFSTTAGCRPRFDGYRANAVFASKKYYSASGTPVDLDSGIQVRLVSTTGEAVGDLGSNSVLKDGVLYGEYKTRMYAFDLDGAKRLETEFDPVNPDTTRYDAKQVKALRNFVGKRKFVTVRVTPRWTLRLGSAAVHGDFEARKIIAGSRLYHGVNRTVTVYDVSAVEGPRELQTLTVPGTVGSLVAADGRLFIVTQEGQLWCYGSKTLTTKNWERGPDAPTPHERHIEETFGVEGGCGVLLGLDDAARPEELCRRSSMHWIVVDADATFAAKVRGSAGGVCGGRCHVLAGDPLAFELPPYVASLILVEAPRVAASLLETRTLARLYASLRPFGGKLAVVLDAGRHDEFNRAVEGAALAKAVVTRSGKYSIVERRGALPGAGDWTHHEGDAGNTRFSRDTLVKPPFAVLWFGASDAIRHLDRHTRHPRPLVVGGRVFIEGSGELNAADIYTGRLLWKKEVPQLAKPFDTWLWQPGAQSLGGDTAAVEDVVYVVTGDKTRCLKLDAATGGTLGTFTLGDREDAARTLRWGAVFVWNDLLVAGARPLDETWNYDFRQSEFPADGVAAFVERIRTWRNFKLEPKAPGDDDLGFVLNNLNRLVRQRTVPDVLDDDVRAKADPVKLKELTGRITELAGTRELDRTRRLQLFALNRELLKLVYPELPALVPRKYGPGGLETWEDAASRELVGMSRHTGKVLWRRQAKACFRHSAVAVGRGRVYAIDKWPPGIPEKGPDELLALDARTGGLLWRKTEDVTGGFLAYSEPNDVLLQSFGYTNPQLVSSRHVVAGQLAYRGSDGSVLWRRREGGRGRSVFVFHDRYLIAPDGEKIDVSTGRTLPTGSVATGTPIEMPEAALGGCGNPIGSAHLLTGRAGCAWQHLSRAGSAGFYDLDQPLGNQVLGGFRASCMADLICAGGLLHSYNTGFDCWCLGDQVKGALALVHDDEAENWSYLNDRYVRLPQPTGGIGINFGAPGFNVDAHGTLWLAYPGVDEPGLIRRRSLTEGFDVTGSVEYYYRHALRLKGDGLRWVAASGAKGIEQASLALGTKGNARYTVRLHFAEPDDLKAGERVFDVKLQGKTVLEDFDVVREAGGTLRPVVREFKHVPVDGKLTLRLVPGAVKLTGRTVPIISGIEIALE